MILREDKRESKAWIGCWLGCWFFGFFGFGIRYQTCLRPLCSRAISVSKVSIFSALVGNAGLVPPLVFGRSDHQNQFECVRWDRRRGLGLGLYQGPSSAGGIIEPTREHILLPESYTIPYRLTFSKTCFSMRYKKQANIRAHNPAVSSRVMILLVKSVYHQDFKNWKALIHNRGIFG